MACPLIGAGTGGMDARKVESWMAEEVKASAFKGEVILVRFKK